MRTNHRYEVLEVRGDADGSILNGKSNRPYLPADPERRARLLTVLGLGPEPDEMSQTYGKAITHG